MIIPLPSNWAWIMNTQKLSFADRLSHSSFLIDKLSNLCILFIVVLQNVKSHDCNLNEIPFIKWLF